MSVIIDHIGIAVRDIEKARGFYSEVLGLEVGGREEVPGGGLTVAFIQAGQSKIELLEPTGPENSVAKFLESRGEGIHHVCFRVDDIEQALERARAAGYRLIDETPRPGAGGARIAFLHPKTLSGVLVELCEHH